MKSHSGVLCLAAMLLCFAVGVADNTHWHTGESEVFNDAGEHFAYTVEDERAVLTQYWVEEGAPQPAVVRVPATVAGLPLTDIGPAAFDNWDVFENGHSYDGQGVERIVLPEGVTTLRSGAFLCAHSVGAVELPSTLSEIETGWTFMHVIAKVEFPNGNPYFTMDDGFLIDQKTSALLYCSLEAETLPLPQVKRIEDEALENYAVMQNVLTFPDSVEYIGARNAYDCVNLEAIIVPGSVKELADNALYCNDAKRIELDEGLERIGACALAETKIESLTVPSTVTWVGFEAFPLEDEEITWLNPDCYLETEAEYDMR